MIDSHCHLAGEEFVSDLDAVVARARDAGLTRVLVILAAQDDAEWARAQPLPTSWSAVHFAVGVHPHQAHLFAEAPQRAADAVAARIAQSSHVRGIGEIGLDYHYDLSPKDVQQEVFRAQLGLARSRALPVAIHTREAEADTLELITAAQRVGPVSGVFHCFTGDAGTAERALATGFYLSFSGIVTFPKATDLREAARITPLERILVETDAPYLAPVPFRGKRNEPSWVTRTLEAVARERGMSAAELAEAVRDNFDRLFGTYRSQTPVAQAPSDRPSR